MTKKRKTELDEHPQTPNFVPKQELLMKFWILSFQGGSFEESEYSETNKSTWFLSSAVLTPELLLPKPR